MLQWKFIFLFSKNLFILNWFVMFLLFVNMFCLNKGSVGKLVGFWLMYFIEIQFYVSD